MSLKHCVLPLLLTVSAVAGAGDAQFTIADGTGPHPILPPPEKSWLPTLNIAPAKGWLQGAKPQAAAGMAVKAFATNLDHPRWLYVLPNGDVLVAETDAPAKPQDSKGLRGWIQKKVMKHAGSGASPSADRISLLRDRDGDGIAETRSVFLQGLHSPLGMALIGKELFVANTDAVLRFHYETGQTQIQTPGSRLTELPAGAINHHWTKSLIASADGSKLYVGVGSNSNVAENGLAAEQERAAVWEIDVGSGRHRLFASGLRNPVGLAWEPQSGALWVAVNERDELGGDLVPDYMTALREGAFYGWPYSYYGPHLDERVQPQNPALVAQAQVPDYALGPHTASLGLCSAQGARLPPAFGNGMFVAQHGSWNRKPRSGYKVIFVPFADGMPVAPPLDVLSGFLDAEGRAQGRPVGLAIDGRGGLLVADDVGNTIWRLSTSPQPAP